MDPIKGWQEYIENQDVWLQKFNAVDRCFTISNRSDNIELHADNARYCLKRRVVVVTDDDTGSGNASFPVIVTNAPPTALLCLEADPAGCHRRVITQALCARRDDLAVVDL